jgi:hypothetical protein
LDCDVRLELVIGNKKLHVPTAQFPAEILERELKLADGGREGE